MPRVFVWLSRLGATIGRDRRERALNEEIAAHLALLTEDFVAKGLPPEEARLAARRAFGGIDQMKARHRDQRSLPRVDAVLQDVRFTIRQAARHPWPALAAVAALGLGIGVAATVFMILYGMNLRPLPFDEPDRVVGIRVVDQRGRVAGVPMALFDLWRGAASGFTGLSASRDESMSLADGHGPPERASGSRITINTFTMLRVRPLLGRPFAAGDDAPGAQPVVMLGHRLWTARYGARASLVGETIRVNGVPSTVIGVMPATFHFPFQADLWTPLPIDATGTGGSDGPLRPLAVTGRLASDVTILQAEASLDGATVEAGYGAEADAGRQLRVRVQGLNEMYFGADEGIPMLLAGAVVVVLLVATANVTTLLLARATARGREMAIRAALGAGRGRLAGQLLIEGLVLALPSALLGGVLGAVGLALFRREVADLSLLSMPYWTSFAFDRPAVSFIAAVAVIVSLLACLAPVWQLTGARHRPLALYEPRVCGSGAVSRWMGASLLIAQFALTVTLLGATTVLVQSSNTLYTADQIVPLDGLWGLQVSMPEGTYGTSARRRAFFTHLDSVFRATPGIAGGTYATAFPFARGDQRLVALDRARSDPADTPPVTTVGVGAGYFEVVGVPLLEGRGFNTADLERRDVAIVNTAFVSRFSPERSALGRQVFLADPRTPATPAVALTIVGISPPIRQVPMGEASPVVYSPFAIGEATDARLLVRAAGDASFMEPLRSNLQRWDPDLPLFGVQAIQRISEFSRWAHRVVSTLLVAFACICTVLAGIALFASASFGVERRMTEIGVRMALGATMVQVARVFLGATVVQVGVGTAIGMGGAVAVGIALSGLLVRGARVADPWVLGGIVGLLAAIVIIAVAAPLRRALAVDPAVSLRHD